MFIKQMILEGVEGDVEIRHTEGGALVIANDIEQIVGRSDSREERYGIAWNACKVLCGTTRKDEPNATNSMIWDVMREIDRVAGC